MTTAITLKEIEQIFAVIEPLGVSREAVVIPLRPEHPGHVRRIPGGKLEIVVDREADFAQWLTTVPDQVRAALGR